MTDPEVTPTPPVRRVVDADVLLHRARWIGDVTVYPDDTAILPQAWNHMTASRFVEVAKAALADLCTALAAMQQERDDALRLSAAARETAYEMERQRDAAEQRAETAERKYDNTRAVLKYVLDESAKIVGVPMDTAGDVVMAVSQLKEYGDWRDKELTVLRARVERLEREVAVARWQSSEDVHPLTCGNDSRHALLFYRNGELACPDCKWTQPIPDFVATLAATEAQ